ncbi:reverse transcriptase/maturase family protein [Myxococcota bacterium]|nr:reverse transcriptase/maturase family protein [Myxococcota bacterium]
MPTWLTPAALARAFREVGATASPGVDGESGADFARELQAQCRRLVEEVEADRYRPRPLLRLTRPKADGGVRVLGVPCVRDRVLQRAAVEAATPTVEGRLRPQVHGYRPGRSPRTAIAMLCAQADDCTQTALVKADVAGLFDTLPHSGVAQAARGLLAPPWDALVAAWLAAWPTSPGRGLPQGAPLSPMLANLALAELVDRPLALALPPLPRPRAWVRYGDDLLVVTSAAESTRLTLHLGGLLAAGGLRLAPGKVLSAAARAGPVPFPVLGRGLRWRADGRGGLALGEG